MKTSYLSNSYLVIFLILLAFPRYSSAQTVFEQVYSCTMDQDGLDVTPTSDGGYLMVATTKTSIPNDLDVLILKTNSMGDTTWTKRYGSNMVDFPNRILPISGGNFFIVGYTIDPTSWDQDVYLLKINSVGDTLWTKRYGGWGNEDGKEIIATADGNYVIVGASNSISSSDNQAQLIKINPSGAVLWTKYYGGGNYESARSVKLCLDGGFIVVGKTALSVFDPASVFVFKTNSLGDTLWTKVFGGPNSYEGKSVVVNSDGTYTFCVDDSSAVNDSDIRVMKINALGTLVWNKLYSGTEKDICKMITPTSDGGYVIAAISRSFGWTNPDMWILKLNMLGDTLWTKNYGGTHHEHCYSVKQTTDGGYITVGKSRSYSPNTQIMLVKTNPAGGLTVGSGFLASETKILNVYPNPSNGIFQIDLNSPDFSGVLQIHNALGQILFSENIEKEETRVIDLEGKTPGVYYVTVRSGEGTTTKKLVLN